MTTCVSIDVDDDGYPTDAMLDAITHWPHREYRLLMGLIKDKWHLASWGWDEEYQENDFREDVTVYRISTGGWSGNESIINALSRNHLFWSKCWVSSRRGGHYVFEVPRTHDAD